MYKLITDDARDRILEEANSRGIYPTFAKMDDRPFYLFEGWADIHKVEEIAAAMVKVGDLENGYTWQDYQEAIQSANNKAWRIEWAIGDYGFTDQFMPCEHCAEAIDLHSMYANYWLDQITGSILCYSCLAANADWQGEYLDYCSSSYANRDQMGDTIEIADRSIADPIAHGWHVIGYDKDIECFRNDNPNEEFSSGLIYADYKDHDRLYRSAHLIDEDIQILIQYGRYGHSYIYWARFDPNAEEEIVSNRLLFDYVIGLVFKKYRKLLQMGK